MTYKICMICGRHIHGEHKTVKVATKDGEKEIHSGRCYGIYYLMNK